MDQGKYVIPRLSESEFSRKIHQQCRQKIQGIEKVWIPYYEFNVLATFSDGSAPYRKIYHCDGVLLTMEALPDDYSEPQLVDRSSGTLFPVAFDPREARIHLQEHVILQLSGHPSNGDASFSLNIEYSGKFFFPFWVAYFQGVRPDLFELMVFEPLTGMATAIGKQIVNKGFILLDEAKIDLPPWF